MIDYFICCSLFDCNKYKIVYLVSQLIQWLVFVDKQDGVVVPAGDDGPWGVHKED